MKKRLDDDFDIDDLLSNDSETEPDVPDNQLYLPSGKIITFNDQQYEGIQKIRKWLKSDKTFFTLAGSAGTGKSSIIKKILDEFKWGVVVSAPTHKAKGVIAEFTNKDAKTLHSLLGLRPDVNLDEFNPNSPVFNPIATPQITDYNLVIIDEASMINEGLYNLIQEKTKDSRTKVLFMGDPAQIPPVSEVISAVFNRTDIEYHWLTKIERQQITNPLVFIYDDLRQNLESIDGGFLRKSNMNDKGEGVIFTVDKRDFRKRMIEKFRSDEFKKNADFVKTIAWKNDTVMTSNRIIREDLLGKNTDVVEVGDLLMGYRTISNSRQTYNIIENSADYQVVEKSAIEQNSYGIKGYQVKLREEIGKGKFNYDDVFIVDIYDHDNLHLYGQMHDFFRDMGKVNKKMWVKYYDFRRNNMLMCTIDKYINGTYRSTSDTIVKDIDYGYCITGHKSQGSTYSHVFILEEDIKQNWVVKERNQIFYVCLSRPSISATVLTTKIDE
jgi:ATP-dependent exoDNAse (exonuclease V) alpha subunit